MLVLDALCALITMQSCALHAVLPDRDKYSAGTFLPSWVLALCGCGQLFPGANIQHLSLLFFHFFVHSLVPVPVVSAAYLQEFANI